MKIKCILLQLCFHIRVIHPLPNMPKFLPRLTPLLKCQQQSSQKNQCDKTQNRSNSKAEKFPSTLTESITSLYNRRKGKRSKTHKHTGKRSYLLMCRPATSISLASKSNLLQHIPSKIKSEKKPQQCTIVN